jgi:hypothetical protein
MPSGPFIGLSGWLMNLAYMLPEFNVNQVTVRGIGDELFAACGALKLPSPHRILFTNLSEVDLHLSDIPHMSLQTVFSVSCTREHLLCVKGRKTLLRAETCEHTGSLASFPDS